MKEWVKDTVRFFHHSTFSVWHTYIRTGIHPLTPLIKIQHTRRHHQWRWGEPATIASVALTWVNGINYTSAEVEEQAHFLSTLFGCRVRTQGTRERDGRMDGRIESIRRGNTRLLHFDHPAHKSIKSTTGAAVLQPLPGVVVEGPDARKLHVHPRADRRPCRDGARQALVHGASFFTLVARRLACVPLYVNIEAWEGCVLHAARFTAINDKLKHTIKTHMHVHRCCGRWGRRGASSTWRTAAGRS